MNGIILNLCEIALCVIVLVDFIRRERADFTRPIVQTGVVFGCGFILIKTGETITLTSHWVSAVHPMMQA